jgi:hypothetical protein
MTTTGPGNGSLLLHGGSSSGQLDQETIDQFVVLVFLILFPTGFLLRRHGAVIPAFIKDYVLDGLFIGRLDHRLPGR